MYARGIDQNVNPPRDISCRSDHFDDALLVQQIDLHERALPSFGIAGRRKRAVRLFISARIISAPFCISARAIGRLRPPAPITSAVFRSEKKHF